VRTLSTRDADGIATAIEKREPFRTYGALSGGPVRIGSAGRLGMLSPEHRSLWHQGVILARNGHTMYAVWSYETPIAWRLDDGAWIFPSVTYSRTSSAHASKVRHAIHLTGAEVSS